MDLFTSTLFLFFLSSLAVGTKTGYKLFDLKKLDKLDLIYEDSKLLMSTVFVDFH